MNLDDYKLDTPPELEFGSNECRECESPCDGDYCSERCYKESLQ